MKRIAISILNSAMAVLAVAVLLGCSSGNKMEVFEYSKPVDLSFFLDTYDWYTKQDVDFDSLYAKIVPDRPEEDMYLIDGDAPVLSLPEYLNAEQPFLAQAELFFNSCMVGWNVYSDFEVYYRGEMNGGLCDTDDIRRSIQSVGTDCIRDEELRKEAQAYKDSILALMNLSGEDLLGEDAPDVMDYVMAYGAAIEQRAYRFYDDEEEFVVALDSVNEVAEGMAMDKFQHYLDASEDLQLKVILGELASCSNFDEQCSLWRNWANCNKSKFEDEWIIAVGAALMKSGNYSPILNMIWITWRALCQTMFYGSSRDSSIPNNYYNTYRLLCYKTCLKRIERQPDDIFAMNCAASIGGRTNMNRFGQNYFGNEAMVEYAEMMPNRFDTGDDDEEE